jgi:iron(III) transport system substrate-binding protein
MKSHKTGGIMMKILPGQILFLLMLLTLPVFGESVVVYTAHDRIFSEPILKVFNEKTGIDVRPVYDTEATKTVGLVNRLMAEGKRPVCDVFWNNEIVRTIYLQKEGLIESYHSPSARSIPEEFKSSEGYWTGFAARARVILYNTNIVKPGQAPQSVFDLLDARWKGKAGIANPLFGTTSTHAAALFEYLHPVTARAFFEGLRKNDIKILSGNATARDDVAAGILPWCLTDTDDAKGALLDGRPVKVVFPDQNGMGTLVIPNTVCLIKNAPNPEAGKKLIDFLLSEEVEEMLADSPAAQIPVRKTVPRPPDAWSIKDIRTLNISWENVAEMLDVSQPWLQDEFLR